MGTGAKGVLCVGIKFPLDGGGRGEHARRGEEKERRREGEKERRREGEEERGRGGEEERRET